MLEPVIVGAASRLAAQLVIPKLRDGAFGDRRARALRNAIQAACASALGDLVDASVADVDIIHLESVLGRLFADDQVAESLVDAALAGADPPTEALSVRFEQLGLDHDTLGVDLPVLVRGLGSALRTEILEEARKPESPLFNLYMVSQTEQALTGPPQRVMGTAPPLPQQFVGRETDLAVLREWLQPGSRGVQTVVALQGWPGVGKTTTAAMLAHDAEVARMFPDGVLWARLGRQEQVAAELAAWLRSVRVEPGSAADPDHLSARMAAVLRHARMLLVVDDAWDEAAAERFTIGGSGCATVLTTRARSIADRIATSPAFVHVLPVLDDGAAVNLLAALCPAVFHARRDSLDALVRAVEGLPLALQVAGGLLAADAAAGLPIDVRLTQLADGVELLKQDVPANLRELAEEASPTMAAVLQRSVDALDPLNRLRFISLGSGLAPKPAVFSLATITDVWSELGGPAAVDATQGVRDLVGRGLLETAGPATYQMHGLLATFAELLRRETG